MKAEIEVMFLQDKGCQRLPENHPNLGKKHGTDSPYGPQQESTLPIPGIQNCRLSHRFVVLRYGSRSSD